MAASTFRAWETLGGPEPSEPTISHWLGGHGADAPLPTPRRPQDEVSGCGSSSNQSTQDLRGLPAQRRLEIGDAGALIFPLAVRQRSAAMPAGPRRNRLRPADKAAALLEACEVDDVLRLHYDFLNHCCPRDLASVIAESRRVNVQSNTQILAEQFTPESSDIWNFLNSGRAPPTATSSI